jgi:multiple sugar transport system ATP-binding protein
MSRIEFNRVCKSYADGTRAVVDLDLSIADREFLCILGPSGCGKSSTLRMLAGLEPISSGDLMLDGERINNMPPQARDMAMVFENYALYPHLPVFDNIAMPLKARGLPRAEIQARVLQVAETLQITEHLRKRPRTLSGGQRQRVALGRAIVRKPKVFLMDEPLGHLEAYLRAQLRAEVRRLHEQLGATTVYITHDQEEAEAVSDRIAVMNAGRLQQTGSLLDLLDRPANRFVAEFIGSLPINVLPASVSEDGARLRVGPVGLPLTIAQAARLRAYRDRPLTLGIRPEDMWLIEDREGEATLPARVAVLEPQGERTVLIADTPVGRVSALASSNRAPLAGAPVSLRFAMERAHVFADDGGNLLHGIGARG